MHRENEGVLSVVGPNDETRSRDRLMAVAQDTAHKPPPHKLRTLHLLSLSRFEKRPFYYLQRKKKEDTLPAAKKRIEKNKWTKQGPQRPPRMAPDMI